eukprot:GGOE01014934.1.p1 GENE.GGOE01014934.1~~GGOE01014934.1.p1  ORF type:complete len:259 (-),score=41.00 GGOE01014934.1:428-1204(-)
MGSVSLPDPRFVSGLLLGVAVGAVGVCCLSTWSGWGRGAAADDATGDDDCFSLYYDEVPEPDGRGFPHSGTCSQAVICKLQATHPEYRHLPAHLYRQVVEHLPTVCVDVVCRRLSDGKVLLFHRRDKPAAQIWWFPGGRMHRGETFFAAAVRKTAEETGCSSAAVTARAVLQVWNTFFPDSSWDEQRRPGHEGSQTVNAVVLCDISGDNLDIHLSNGVKDQWAVAAHRWVAADDLLVPGHFDKYLRLNAAIARHRALL